MGGVYLFLLATGLLIIFGRTSYAITSPFLYAEDATWTSSIINNGFIYTCLHAKGSYLVIGNILMIKIALMINAFFFGKSIIHLATIIAIISYIFYDFLAFIGVYLLRNIINIKARIILFYGILLLPMGNTIFEMYGRVNNIGYGFFYIAFVIMLWFFFGEHAIWKKLINYFILVLCCVTNPVSYIILSIILVYDFIKNIISKSIEIILPIVIGGLSVWSLIIMSINKVSDIVQVSEKINRSSLVEFFFRSWMYPFIWPLYNNFNDFKAIVLMLIFIGFCIFLIVITDNKNRKILAVSYLTAIGYAVITLVSRKSLTEWLGGYSSTFPDRYFYVQNIFSIFILCLFISIIDNIIDNKKKIFKNMVSFLVALQMFFLAINLDLIFEFTSCNFLEIDDTFENSIYRTYYEQGKQEYYEVLCPPQELFVLRLPEEYMIESVNNDNYCEFVFRISDKSDP